VRNFLLIIGTFALMATCSAGASLATLGLLMTLGMKLHGDKDYYGQMPAVALIFVASALGFAAPGFIVWYLHNNRWRFTVRTLLIATTLIAVGLGLAAAYLRLW
jgi:hypothetical protein